MVPTCRNRLGRCVLPHLTFLPDRCGSNINFTYLREGEPDLCSSFTWLQFIRRSLCDDSGVGTLFISSWRVQLKPAHISWFQKT